MRRCSLVLVAFAFVLVGCGDLGRTPDEMRAATIAGDKKKADTVALTGIAEACGAPTQKLNRASFSASADGWIDGTFPIDPDVHEKLIDMDKGLGSEAMNAQGYRRQIARQAVCMFVTGSGRGLQGVRLKQRLYLPLQNVLMDTIEIELSRQTITAVPQWDTKTMDHVKRNAVLDAVYKAATVKRDDTGHLEIKTFTR